MNHLIKHVLDTLQGAEVNIQLVDKDNFWNYFYHVYEDGGLDVIANSFTFYKSETRLRYGSYTRFYLETEDLPLPDGKPTDAYGSRILDDYLLLNFHDCPSPTCKKGYLPICQVCTVDKQGKVEYAFIQLYIRTKTFSVHTYITRQIPEHVVDYFNEALFIHLGGKRAVRYEPEKQALSIRCQDELFVKLPIINQDDTHRLFLPKDRKEKIEDFLAQVV